VKSRIVLFLIAICFALSAGRSQEPPRDSGLTVHEWGTFTSIAGARGEAVVWMPQVERDDLPSFVEHLENNRFKGGLQGTVRMETPVLYFYAMHATNVFVHVSFAKGLLTEWYPHATSPLPPEQLTNPALDLRSVDGELQWNSVAVGTSESVGLPNKSAASRYYAARDTSASWLCVGSPGGQQHEKFLFYRGVSSIDVPVSATPLNNNRIFISNLKAPAIPGAILFERRGDRLGYRLLGPIQNSLIAGAPELDSNVEALSRELEKLLVAQGLYPDEAHAMLETWNDSWFEEGTRLLYIVPRPFVDGVLPLAIKPAPANTTRVFVGRMEIVTPTTEHAIETAFANRDHVTLAKYHRFLAPILQTMIARSHDGSRTKTLNAYLNSTYSRLFAALRGAPET